MEVVMHLFHSYVMTWWEGGMFKLLLISFGIIVGATWPTFFKKSVLQWILWLIVIVFAIYLVIAFWPQMF
jgi:hypothetical protein